MNTSPNKGAAPSRRLRLGLVPWSFGFSKSQDSAVGELTVSRFDHAGMRWNLGKVNADYMTRGYLLPQGCKDLIDVITPKVTLTDRGLMITAQFPEVHSEDIEVTCDARQVRISRKQSGGHAAFDSVTDVPPDYDISRARAAYFSGQLRIVIPRH